jgi:hypothetical protein
MEVLAAEQTLSISTAYAWSGTLSQLDDSVSGGPVGWLDWPALLA